MVKPRFIFEKFHISAYNELFGNGVIKFVGFRGIRDLDVDQAIGRELRQIDAIRQFLVRARIDVHVPREDVDVTNLLSILANDVEEDEAVGIAVFGPGIQFADDESDASFGARSEFGDRIRGGHAEVILIVEGIDLAVIIASRVPKPKAPPRVAVALSPIVDLDGGLTEIGNRRRDIDVTGRDILRDVMIVARHG